jgi:hypothetical protein
MFPTENRNVAMIHSTPAPEAEPSNDSHDPRRATPRFECRHVTFYRPVGKRGGDSELATLHNVSTTGIGLLVRERIKKGAILVIELNSTVRKVRHQRLARVAHVTDQGNGYVLIGCEFAKPLSETELIALMA